MTFEVIQTTVVPISSRPEVQQVIHTAIAFSILVGVWAALRLYSSKLRRIPFSIEDELFFTSIVSYFGMIVALFSLIYLGGLGYHMESLQARHIQRLTETMLAIQGLYGLSMCTSKWSILWMLKRIFVFRSFQTITWFIIYLQAAWMIMTLLIGVLICAPIERNWNPTVIGTCGDQIAGYTAVSAVNVAVDIIMCTMPLPVILRLQLKGPYKFALVGIFSTGVVTVFFAIIRLRSLQTVDFGDFPYTAPSMVTWTYAEVGVVILVACSPLLRPVFDKLFRFGQSSKQGGTTKQAHDSVPCFLQMTSPRVTTGRHTGFIAVDELEENFGLSNIKLPKVSSEKPVETTTIPDE